MVQHTEFSNDHYTGPVFGPSTDDCDYIELFVSKCALYPEATEVDIRGWIVDDNANNFNSGGDCVGNFLTSPGHLRFADSPTWESVPVGSIIVLYNTVDNASCFNFTADLAGSGGVYYIPVGSTGLMEASSNAPTSSSCDYCTASYASYNPWWGIVTDNERDAIQVRCPGCGEEEGGPSFYHGLSWGTTDMGPIAAGGNDLGGAHMNMSGRGKTFILDTDDLEEIKAGLGWTSTTAVSSRPTAGSVSAQLRAALLGRGLPCCAGNEPVIAEKATYRFGFQGQEKDNEVYGSEGNSYDFVARMYDARVGRWPSIDPLAAKYPFVTPYGFTNNSPILNREQDGREWVNVHAQRLASLRERQLNNPNDKSIQRAIARETKSAARIDALLTAVRTNDQALYNYVDQLRVQISKDGFQNVKVFVSDDPRVSGPGGEKGSTGFLPESPTGTTKAVGFNGEGILAPYAMGEIGFDVKIHATAGDATLANEAGDVMFQMEYGAKDALQGRSKLTTDMNLNVDEYRKKESTRYSDRVEERYSERKKNGQGADSGNNPYPLPRNEEKPK